MTLLLDLATPFPAISAATCSLITAIATASATEPHFSVGIRGRHSAASKETSEEGRRDIPDGKGGELEAANTVRPSGCNAFSEHNLQQLRGEQYLLFLVV